MTPIATTLEAFLSDKFYYGTDVDDTVLGILCDVNDLEEDEVLAMYGDCALMSATVSMEMEDRMTFAGNGWGSYYGPSPAEYDRTGYLCVMLNGVVLFDNSFGEDGPCLKGLDK